jgi:hypothetical protein
MKPGGGFDSGYLGLGGGQSLGKLALSPTRFNARQPDRVSDLASDIEFRGNCDHDAMDTIGRFIAGSHGLPQAVSAACHSGMEVAAIKLRHITFATRSRTLNRNSMPRPHSSARGGPRGDGRALRAAHRAGCACTAPRGSAGFGVVSRTIDVGTGISSA